MNLRRHFTYANIVATICLVLVVGGGTAWAAVRITSGNIVDGTIQRRDIKTSAIDASRLAAAVRPPYTGSRHIAYEKTVNSPLETVFEGGGMRVRLGCGFDGIMYGLDAVIEPTSDNSFGMASLIRGDSGAVEKMLESDFDTSESFFNSFAISAQGTIDIVAPDARHAHLEYFTANNAPTGCHYFGTVTTS